MTEKEKKSSRLEKNELKEVKGGIPYMTPVLIDLSDGMGSCRTGTHCETGGDGSCGSGRYCATGTHKDVTISE